MKRLSLLSVLLFSSAVSMAQKSVVSDEHYTMLNIVPLRLDDEAVSAADALELYNKAGVRYPLYSLTLHPEGRPAMAKVERAVASYRRFADALKGTGVRPGILVQAIIGHWPRTDKEIEPWQRTINIKGDAVGALLRRGFGDLIGVKKSDDACTFTNERHEALGLDAPLPAASKPVLFSPVAEAETLSSLVWRPYKAAKEFTRVTSAATFFRNALGGRILCMAYHFRLGGGYRHSEARKRIMFDLLAKLSERDLDGASLNAQNMISQVRRGRDAHLYVHLTNINPDFTGDLRIRTAKRPGKVEHMSDHGEWRSIDFTWHDGMLVMPIDLPLWGEAAVRIRE